MQPNILGHLRRYYIVNVALDLEWIIIHKIVCYNFQSNSSKGPILRVFPLYAQLAEKRQMDVFTPSAPGTRKVILSTNIAETSLTIPGIKYVIDSGVVKRRVYDPSSGMDSLKVVKVCRDQAWQRCGRAGRDSDGFCYRAYTVKEFNAMPLSSLPEIQRSNICSTVCE